jgi:predicted metal-dependent hydrolase
MPFFRFKNKPTKEKKLAYLNEAPVVVHIIHENRSNCRVSIGKSGITIRLSNYMTTGQKEEQTQKFLQWCEKKIKEKPEILAKKVRHYHDGMELNLFDRKLLLQISTKNVEKASGSIKGDMLMLVMPEGIGEEEMQQISSMLVSKMLARIYKPIVWKKILHFNELHGFGKVNGIRMKNNASNWGSCSTKGNINISVRLMMANEAAVDYVIIHELAHLKEANHSSRFWKIVEQACPDYKIHERWLKENSRLCII